MGKAPWLVFHSTSSTENKSFIECVKDCNMQEYKFVCCRPVQDKSANNCTYNCVHCHMFHPKRLQPVYIYIQ
jgi:hypothetical protein